MARLQVLPATPSRTMCPGSDGCFRLRAGRVSLSPVDPAIGSTSSPEQVDALHFGELAALGKAALDRGDHVAAAGFLSAALALWRGPALADVQDSAFAPITARRLESDRLAAFESLDRCTARPRPTPRGRLRPRARRRRRPLPRAVPRPAHDRPLPLRAPGGRAGRVPKSSGPAGRRPRSRARAASCASSNGLSSSRRRSWTHLGPAPRSPSRGCHRMGDVAAHRDLGSRSGPGSAGRRRRQPVKWAVLVAVACATRRCRNRGSDRRAQNGTGRGRET